MTDEIKQRVEAFMAEYFQAKIDLEKRHLDIRIPYRKKFYSDDCFYDSRKHTIAKLQSETILDVQETGEEVLVITRQTAHTSMGSVEMEQRYHLQPSENQWRIHKVDMACVACHGKDPNCYFCKGDCWSGKLST